MCDIFQCGNLPAVRGIFSRSIYQYTSLCTLIWKSHCMGSMSVSCIPRCSCPRSSTIIIPTPQTHFHSTMWPVYVFSHTVPKTHYHTALCAINIIIPHHWYNIIPHYTYTKYIQSYFNHRIPQTQHHRTLSTVCIILPHHKHTIISYCMQ